MAAWDGPCGATFRASRNSRGIPPAERRSILADHRARRVPDGAFSMAALQGILLRTRASRYGALREVLEACGGVVGLLEGRVGARPVRRVARRPLRGGVVAVTPPSLPRARDRRSRYG